MKWASADKADGDESVRIDRLERVLGDYVETGNFYALQQMNTDFSQETKILVEDVLKLGSINDPNIDNVLRNYYKDHTIMQLMSDVKRVYPDMLKVSKSLGKAFHRLQQEDPKFCIPRVYTQVSALNQSIVVGDSTLGISLDKYLGSDYPLYRKYYYDYQRRTMKRDRIVPDCLVFYLESEYPLKDRGHRTALYHILQVGKFNWVISQVLDHSVSSVLGLSDDTKKWWDGNEHRLWAKVKETGWLTTKDSMNIRRIMYNSFDVSLKGRQDVDGIGAMLGASIIDSYMKKNPKCTIGALLSDRDYNKILAQSGYNPQ